MPPSGGSSYTPGALLTSFILFLWPTTLPRRLREAESRELHYPEQFAATKHCCGICGVIRRVRKAILPPSTFFSPVCPVGCVNVGFGCPGASLHPSIPPSNQRKPPGVAQVRRPRPVCPTTAASIPPSFWALATVIWAPIHNTPRYGGRGVKGRGRG